MQKKGSEPEFSKQELQLKAQQYLETLEGGVKHLSKDIKKTGTVALLMGGVFFAAFLIGRKMVGAKSSKKIKSKKLQDNQLMVKTPKSESPIARMIKEHIAIFLIALIKERLMVYLSETEKEHEPVQ